MTVRQRLPNDSVWQTRIRENHYWGVEQEVPYLHYKKAYSKNIDQLQYCCIAKLTGFLFSICACCLGSIAFMGYFESFQAFNCAVLQKVTYLGHKWQFFNYNIPLHEQSNNHRHSLLFRYVMLLCFRLHSKLFSDLTLLLHIFIQIAVYDSHCNRLLIFTPLQQDKISSINLMCDM